MQERKILIADEGKVLTNGTHYGKVVFLAENASADGYREISKEEYEDIAAAAAPFGTETIIEEE